MQSAWEQSQSAVKFRARRLPPGFASDRLNPIIRVPLRTWGQIQRRGLLLVKALISTVGVLLLASAAFAQTDRGTITGTVLDPTGAVVAGASIEAKNAATSETYNAGT